MLGIKKKLLNYWIFIFASILFAMHFFMIECSYDVIDLFIFVIYDVQYVVATYGSKINWIYVFANHKWIIRVLNALVFMFLGVHLKKMFSFVNLLFKLYIYVFSSRFKNFIYLKNDMSSFSFNFFKDWNIWFACVCRYCCENE